MTTSEKRGGPVSRNESVIIGERGVPELVIPLRSATPEELPSRESFKRANVTIEDLLPIVQAYLLGDLKTALEWENE